ncbi:MAG: InlB B-repeat-containing protein [Clostridia bacterium]|nr:InlB B-repeat-containing protein [Clostridia bacterium]
MKTNPIKKIFGLLLVAMLAVLPLAIAGCKKEDPAPTYYTVTFDADNGTTNTTIQVEENKKVTAPTAPTKAGFAFDGWFNNLTEWNFETDVVTSNLTLKAHWTEIYTVTFDADNGTTNTTVQVEENKKVTAPTEPTKEGFAFDGWFNNLTEWNFETDIVTSNLTLKAHWTDVRVPVFTTQPTDLEVSYPKGGSLSVEVENPELVESYQWQEWMKGYDDEELWQDMDGTSASTPTLQLKSTMHNSYHCRFRCVVTNKNGKTATSDEAKIILSNEGEFVPFVRIGEYAVEPGECLDLSTTQNGTGKIYMEEKDEGDRYDITLESVNFNNTKCIASDVYASIGLELQSDCNVAHYYYIHLKGNNVFTNVKYYPEWNSAGIPFCCNWLSATSVKPTIIFDGTGLLTLNGGTELIYTNSPVKVQADLNLISSKDIYGNGIKCKGLTIDKDVCINAKLNGALFIMDDQLDATSIYINENAMITADLSIGRVGSGYTQFYAIKAKGEIKLYNAHVALTINTEPSRFAPTEQGVEFCYGINGTDVKIWDSHLTIKMYAGYGEYPAYGYTGIQGDKITFENSKVDIDIDSINIFDSYGIEVMKDGLIIENASSVSINVKTSGVSYGIMAGNHEGNDIEIYSSNVKVYVDSYEETPEASFGISGTYYFWVAMSTEKYIDVTCTKGFAFAFKIGAGNEPNAFDDGYVVQRMTSINGIIKACDNEEEHAGVINQGCFALNETRYVYVETIYDANDKTTPAHHVVISQAKIKD